MNFWAHGANIGFRFMAGQLALSDTKQAQLSTNLAQPITDYPLMEVKAAKHVQGPKERRRDDRVLGPHDVWADFCDHSY